MTDKITNLTRGPQQEPNTSTLGNNSHVGRDQGKSSKEIQTIDTMLEDILKETESQAQDNLKRDLMRTLVEDPPYLEFLLPRLRVTESSSSSAITIEQGLSKDYRFLTAEILLAYDRVFGSYFYPDTLAPKIARDFLAKIQMVASNWSQETTTEKAIEALSFYKVISGAAAGGDPIKRLSEAVEKIIEEIAAAGRLVKDDRVRVHLPLAKEIVTKFETIQKTEARNDLIKRLSQAIKEEMKGRVLDAPEAESYYSGAKACFTIM